MSAKGEIYRWRQHILVISQEGHYVSEKQAKPLQENEAMVFYSHEGTQTLYPE